MYKLIFQTPEGAREVTFETRPTPLQVSTAAVRLADRSLLCALVQTPKKEAVCVSQ